MVLFLYKKFTKIGGVDIDMRTRKPVKLTLKTAKEIIKRELDISTVSLKPATGMMDGVCRYEMTMGRTRIIVENDWFSNTGLYSLAINHCNGGCIKIFYNPSTLEEDYEACDKYRLENL